MICFLYVRVRVTADNDLITIADDSDFAHAREYAQRGVVKMIVYGKSSGLLSPTLCCSL